MASRERRAWADLISPQVFADLGRAL